MKNVYGYIYKIENLINGKVYIGKTTRTFKERYKYNLEKNTHNNHLKNSIKKYGIDNFYINEEFDKALTKEELNEKEKYWIEHYKSNDEKYGYNILNGGDDRKDDYIFKSKKYSCIYCPDLGELFNSVGEAELFTGIGKTSISLILNSVEKKLFFDEYDGCRYTKLRFCPVYDNGNFIYYERGDEDYFSLIEVRNLRDTSSFIDFLKINSEIEDEINFFELDTDIPMEEFVWDEKGNVYLLDNFGNKRRIYNEKF